MEKTIADRIAGFLHKRGNKELLLLLCIFSGFVFFVIALVFSYHLSTEQGQFSPLIGPLVNYHVEFMIAVATLGIAVGAGAFYLLSVIIEKKNTESKWNASLLLRFLNEDEREVVALMLKRRGSIHQSEIAALDGMGRVKAHRVVAKLMRRGVISVRKIGKINVLEMPQELLEGLDAKTSVS